MADVNEIQCPWCHNYYDPAREGRSKKETFVVGQKPYPVHCPYCDGWMWVKEHLTVRFEAERASQEEMIDKGYL